MPLLMRKKLPVAVYTLKQLLANSPNLTKLSILFNAYKNLGSVAKNPKIEAKF